MGSRGDMDALGKIRNILALAGSRTNILRLSRLQASHYTDIDSHNCSYLVLNSQLSFDRELFWCKITVAVFSNYSEHLSKNWKILLHFVPKLRAGCIFFVRNLNISLWVVYPEGNLFPCFEYFIPVV